MKKTVLIGLLAAGALFALDNVQPSSAAPAGLDSMKIPQLITLGFDDNRYEDGVRWVVDTLLGGRMNPSGLGNPATFDGSKLRCSFFVISNADQRDSWREAYEYGCEIGNHTVTHELAMFDENATSHMHELGGCSKYIVNDLGLPPSHIQGFRTPFLAFQEQGLTFQTVKNLGMFYDASVENGTQSSDIQWTRPNFPWTLDYTITSIASAGSTPGLWQVPHVNYLKASEGIPRNKGFDSGLWPATTPGLNLSGPEALEYFKGTLDFHYGNRKLKFSWEADSTIAGNRAPMDMGFHSDYYSIVASDPNNPDHNPDYINLRSSVQERRQALMDFVDYALTFPDVRFVTMGEIVRWMQNPVQLDDLSQADKFGYSESVASPNLLETAGLAKAEAAGSSMNFGSIVNGVVPVTVTVDDAVDTYVAVRNLDLIVELGTNLDGVDGFSLTYTSDIPLRITFMQEGLLDSDESYYFAVSTASESKTVSIPLNDLHIHQPPYAENVAALDLSKVTEIAVSPMAIDSVVEGTFELESIHLFGSDKFGEGVAVETIAALQGASLAMSNFSANSTQLTLSESGVYTMDIFSASGRKLTSLEGFLPAGINVVEWREPLSSGLYVVQIKGDGVNQSLRQLIR